MNELNKLYKAMLESWGCVIKPDSRIVLRLGGDEVDVKIDDMAVYLPVSEALDSTDSMHKVFFHPACENIVSKETEVFKIIRRMAVIHMLELFKKYPVVLLSIAGGKEKSKWSQSTLDIINPLTTVKKPVVEEIKKLMARFKVEVDENGQDNRFIHIKVSRTQGRSSTGSGERVYYKAKPSFPIYNEIVKRLSQSEGQADNQTVELNGHSVSRAALKLMAHLFRSIIPAVMDPDSASTESTTSVASRLIAFCTCYEQVAEQMNRIQNLFRAEFNKLGIYPIDLSWTEQLDELPEIWRQIPALDYNTNNTQEESASSSAGNLGGILAITSSGSNQQAVAQNPQQQLITQAQIAQPMAGTLVGGFNVTPPVMIGGDRWLRYEIDVGSNQVIHHAINTVTNAAVIYYCTKSGTFLQRVENAGGFPGGIPGMPTPGMGAMGAFNPMTAMMTPQMLAMMQLNPALAAMTGMATGVPTTATTAGQSSVTVDNNNSSYTW
jgi:hypothetical protein